MIEICFEFTNSIIEDNKKLYTFNFKFAKNFTLPYN